MAAQSHKFGHECAQTQSDTPVPAVPNILGTEWAQTCCPKQANFEYRKLDSDGDAQMTGFRTGKLMVRLAGIEPTTLGFGGQYSIH